MEVNILKNYMGTTFNSNSRESSLVSRKDSRYKIDMHYASHWILTIQIKQMPRFVDHAIPRRSLSI